MENNYYIYQYICAEKGMVIYVEKCNGEFAEVECKGQRLIYHINALKREKDCLFDESDLGESK